MIEYGEYAFLRNGAGHPYASYPFQHAVARGLASTKRRHNGCQGLREPLHWNGRAVDLKLTL